jgi:hypothetical protein
MVELARISEASEEHNLRDSVSQNSLRARVRELYNVDYASWSPMSPTDWTLNIRRMPDEHGANEAVHMTL